MLKEINIKLSYILDNEPKKGNMKLNLNDNLENAFNKCKSIKIPKNKKIEIEFYLKKENEKIPLDKKVKIKELNLKEGDLIFVSFKDNINNIDNINTHYNPNLSSENLNTEIDSSSNAEKPLRKRKNFLLIIYISIAIIIIGVIIILIIHFTTKKNKSKKIINEDTNSDNNNENDDNSSNNDNIDNKDNTDFKSNNDQDNNATEKIYYIEELITKKRPFYPNNSIFLYKSNKTMSVELESELKNETDESNMTDVKEFMDFGLIIREESQEIFEEESLIRNWFTGYIILQNLIINNGTNDMYLNFNKELRNIIAGINDNNKRNLNEANDSVLLNDEKELCFVRIHFYENGEIKDIFYPKDFKIENMVYINTITKLIIPKLSKHLYSENLNEKIQSLNNFMNSSNEEEQNDSIVDSTFINEQDINSDIIDSEKIFYDPKHDYSDEIDNEFLDSDNLSSSNDDTHKYHLKGIEENGSFSNITDFELESMEGAQAKLEGSLLKRIKNSLIDEKGMLTNIIESESITITQPGSESLDTLTEEEEKLKSEIYNDNNEIPRMDEEDFAGKNISFDISNIKCVNFNNVSLYDNIINAELAENIFKYFDSFSYTKYNISENEDLKFRVLKDIKNDILKENPDLDPSEIIVEHSKLSNKKNNNKRYLQNSVSYYGMKNYINEKIIFKYNLIGLILEGIVVSEINVATGVTDNYFLINIGSLDLKIPFNRMKTNLHVVIKNSHQMTYNIMGLLYNSNEELKKRNQIYSDIILDLEKKMASLMGEYYDYSGLFKDSLDYLYNQVKNFSGEFFNELIILIENVYDNYTIILNKTENEEFEIMNEIRNVTKKEYMDYINKMFEIILSFKDNTLQLLIDIKKEVDKIKTFQIDILYDIVDIISDSLLLFKEFQENLFKAVDKGITNFKYDLRDYIEETIGDLLYLTDFLSINMNKNEILINAIDFEKRETVTIKLKNFRDIVLRILEILNDNIINDYEEEMSIKNENSLKYSKEYLIKKCIEELDNNSTILIGEIKSKIYLINHYEVYAENIQIINEINNISLIEFNNEISEQALNYINQILPEYAVKNSDLIKNKNHLFSLTEKVVSTINQEIDDINDYINSYSNNYINNYNYILDYNLYYFRKYFKDENISPLVKEFKEIVTNSLKTHFISLVIKNYDLAYEYMNDVRFMLIINSREHKLLLGKIFEDTYKKFKKSLDIMELINSKELIDFISENFCNISTYISNYVNNKLKSINKYNFNEKNSHNFFKLELIQEEIDKISKNINNYFNASTFANIEILNPSSQNEIYDFINTKQNYLDELYYKIYDLAVDKKIIDYQCAEIIELDIEIEPIWFTLGILSIVKKTYICFEESKKRWNINKIVKDLSETKKYLSQRFNNLINNYINKIDLYLNNFVYYSKNLYNNLNNYVEGKIINNINIKSTLTQYQDVINNILINYTEEKIMKKNLSNKNLNNPEIINIITKLEKNMFEMKKNFYQNYYLKNKELFLEYPDEIIIKLNQSLNGLKSNNRFIKEKINLSLQNKLKNIISSIKLFINDINKFNLEYIMNSINKENIFDKYILHKSNFIKDFFNSVYNYEQDSISNINNSDKFILNEENYDYYINNVENNYSNFLSNLINEIDENFTIIHCLEEKSYNIDNNSDIFSDSEMLFIDNSIFKNCSKERHSSELNYSKYNFNIVKFRKEISNSKRFPEIIEQFINSLNYNNIIDPNKIIEIDEIINHKNILDILNKTKNKIKAIKSDFISKNQNDFGKFRDEFIKKDGNLTSDYLPFLNTFKEILTFENLYYNNYITETYDDLTNSINELLNEFNSTIFYIINNISKHYNYFSLDYIQLFNNYSKLIDNSFNNYEQRIKNLRNNYNFYSIPKIITNEIFLKKRKNIEEKINQFSNNYDFESIGFKYNFEKELDFYLVNLYMNYEFNYIYDYYELIENNKNSYIDKLLEDISFIKKKQEKFKLIYTNFNKYISIQKNKVSVEYIEEIKFNKSLCLNNLTNLYRNISEDLNKANITETEDYIINNCTIEEIVNSLFKISDNNTCLNISGINSTFYFNQFKSLLFDCKNNNFYNYSFIILDNFGEKNKKKLDNIIENLTNIIISNAIDENYLSNFLKNYYIKDINLEIDMNKYEKHFKEFENNIHTVNLQEADYKNYISDILTESFYNSNLNKINLFIKNEIMDAINILISDKIDIFINYFSNKLKDDFEYFSFLLNQMVELGDSSKSSIIDLFSKIPKKLNESIYILIEGEIFYYIDKFFKENKNIFINNFIKFYLNNGNHFNLTIYKIEEYLKEFISDNNFNKTMNNLSSILITKLKDEIKDNVKNRILTKINNFNKECDLIYERIMIKLDKIKTNQLTDEMKTLIQLLNNHSSLLEHQNSKFSFDVGKSPFNKLNIFISKELQPPLSLILKKYDLIEKELVNRIQPLAEDFPDCYSEVKKNLLGTKMETIDDSLKKINETLLDYNNILIDDIQDYLNKLIHFTYIDGLNAMDKSCEESYCSFPKNSFRRLNKREFIDISNTYKHHSNLVNITMVEKKINKIINFNNKRKVSSFPEYTSDMGALTENDVIYYLSNLQNTIMKLSKLYLGKEYLNINSTTNKFLTTINITYLEKLRNSFELKIAKFSTILTENSINKLKNIILKQYYSIEEYVHKSSILLRSQINYFLSELNKTTETIESLSGYIHNQALGYYSILYSSIQSKYINLDYQILPLINFNTDSSNNLASKIVNETKITIFEVVHTFQSKIKLEFNLTHILKGCLGKTTLGKIMKKMDEISRIEKSFKHDFPIMFPPFPNFQIRATPDIGAGFGFYASIEPNWQELKFNLAFEVYVEAYVSFKVEGGFYMPCSTKSPIKTAFTIGLDGVVAHGRAGMKLIIFLIEDDITFDLYFIVKALSFEFYCQARVEIEFPLFKSEYSYDFFRKKLFSLETEYHTSKKVPKKYEGGKNFPIVFGNPGHND